MIVLIILHHIFSHILLHHLNLSFMCLDCIQLYIALVYHFFDVIITYEMLLITT